jgi:hypothetical protein
VAALRIRKIGDGHQLDDDLVGLSSSAAVA